MSFDGQNIVQKNLHSILQCEDALEKVELFDCAGYRDIGTALFAFVRAKKGNGNQRFFGEMFEKLLKFYIEKLLHIFVECDLFFCQARCFQNGGIIAGESSKGRKQKADAADLARERKLQEAMLSIRKKFGKNAVLKAMNLEEGATAKDRNNQIGGHKA